MERAMLRTAYVFLLLSLLYQKLDLCVSLNAEGRALLRFREKVEVDPFDALSKWVDGAVHPCSWFGVGCSNDGRVVSLRLEDLCLTGTITPELGKLIHLKTLILRNNSFSGPIPREIIELKRLQVLDLGHNNLSGPVPFDLGSISSLEFLVLTNNRFIGNISPKLLKLNRLSERQDDEALLSSNRGSVIRTLENATIRRLLQNKDGKHNAPAQAPASAPSPSPTASPPSRHSSPSQRNKQPHVTKQPTKRPSHSASSPSVSPGGKDTARWLMYMSVAAGASLLIALFSVYMLCWRSNKVVTVMPWRTGLSGQLRKAFVTGVPSLKRSELETACEGFSNVIGSLPGCILYKGTLSSGVEIAVTSSIITSSKDWSNQSEAHFRKKISMLSKVNHKNFMNLIGYCEEEEPFCRMMVYEYAPNGTLFEHLHIKEAEHLDWATRLRIIMGIAYCLEHMLHLDPPVILNNLHSSSVYLSDDYAAQLSELNFCNGEKEADPASESSGVFDVHLSNKEGIIYKFGIVMLEIISGRLPFSEDHGLLVLWASSYLTGNRILKDMVDPTLKSFSEEDLNALCDVIRCCIKPDPKERPRISEVVAKLREITSISPEGATPKLSPLWWAELEIISSEAS